jgi:hypothetical protein
MPTNTITLNSASTGYAWRMSPRRRRPPTVTTR